MEGILGVSWFTSLAFEKDERWRSHARSLTPDVRARWLGHWIHRSRDGGLSWEEPIRTVVSAPHGPVRLRDGRLLYLGSGRIDGERVVAAEESVDGGRSWDLIGTVPLPEDIRHLGLGEPHLVEAKSGKLVAMFRFGTPKLEEKDLYQSESHDGGRTWTEAYRTSILGYPPHLIRLTNDRLLLVYGRRLPPYGERARVSGDEGEPWSDEIVLCSAPNDDLGYPASAQLEDDSILIIYYQIDRPDEKTCLMGTRWRLSPFCA